MRYACCAMLCLLCLLIVPAFAAEEGDQATDDAVAAKLAAIEEKLAELDEQREELEALKAEVRALRDGQSAPDNQAPPPPKEEEKTWDYGGYAQVQLTGDQQMAASPQFTVRRVFNVVKYRVGNSTEGFLVLNTTPTMVGVMDATISATRGDVMLRAGQMKVPWGYELSEPSSIRTVFEYDPALAAMFPGVREIGAMVQTNPGDNHGAQLSLAVLNGNGPRVMDNNPQKDFLVDFRQSFGKGSAYVAANRGTFTEAGGNSFPRRYYGAGARYLGDHLRAQTEFQWGRGHSVYANATPFVGGYGQLGYRIGKGQVFARYSVFDRNRNAAGDEVRTPTFGYAHELNPRNKVTAQVELVNDAATPGGDTRVGVRWQTKS